MRGSLFAAVLLCASCADPQQPPAPSSDPIAVQALSEQLHTAFDKVAERLCKNDFDGAYNLLSPKFKGKISSYQFASMFKMLEAQNGVLKSVSLGATWTARDTKTGVVIAQQHYESKDVMMTYLFQRQNGEWKLAGLKPGNQLPNGSTVQPRQTQPTSPAK